MGEFVRNHWYVAALADEVGREPLARVLLGEPVVLYRRRDGTPVALRDQCPHRKVPLSCGRVTGDDLECGYHGMTFDPAGRCVRIPGQPHIPPGARVRSFPVTEGLGLVWIWAGEPDRADPAERFDLPAYEDPARTVSGGRHQVVACHYQLLTDNLTDPSHVAFVHRTTLGSPAQEEIPVSVHERESLVEVRRWTYDSPPAPIFEALAGMEGHVDRWQYYYMHCPSICVVDFGSCPVGAIGPEDARDGPDAIQVHSCILLTPETERTTHYFYFQLRNFAPGDAAVSERLLGQIEIAFAEDFAILEAQQRQLERFPVTDDVKLALDSAPIRQRRIVERMLAAERSAGLPAGQAAASPFR